MEVGTFWELHCDEGEQNMPSQIMPCWLIDYFN